MPAKVNIDLKALQYAMLSQETLGIMHRQADLIVETARRDAPANRKGSWNMYSRNVHELRWVEPDGMPHVTVVADRHALLIEYGWTDKHERRHPGHHVLKSAIFKARKI